MRLLMKWVIGESDIELMCFIVKVLIPFDFLKMKDEHLLPPHNLKLLKTDNK